MTKVVINVCPGSFGLSDAAVKLYEELSGMVAVRHWEIARTDPSLIKVVNTLGVNANALYAKLKIVDVPDDVEWHIEENDGDEWVAENHRTWK